MLAPVQHLGIHINTRHYIYFKIEVQREAAEYAVQQVKSVLKIPQREEGPSLRKRGNANRICAEPTDANLDLPKSRDIILAAP